MSRAYRIVGLLLLLVSIVFWIRTDWVYAITCTALGAILWRGRPVRPESMPTKDDLR